MEDFTSILWVLLLAASIIGSIATKNKERKRKESAMPDGHTESESPHSLPTPAAPLPEKAWQQVLTELQKQMGSDADEKPRPRKERPITTDTVLSATPVASITSALIQSSDGEPALEEALPDEHLAQQEIGTSHSQMDVMADFELRKAVVWSEILKPKFNEDSN